MAEETIKVTTRTRLQRAAAQMRRTDMDAASRERAAEALERLADDLGDTFSRRATWLARSGLAVLTVALAMLVAGVWVDWRWALTAGVALLVALLLLSASYVWKAVDRG